MPRSVNGTGSGGSGGGGPHDDADHEETFATDADVSASITAAVATETAARVSSDSAAAAAVATAIAPLADTATVAADIAAAVTDRPRWRNADAASSSTNNSVLTITATGRLKKTTQGVGGLATNAELTAEIATAVAPLATTVAVTAVEDALNAEVATARPAAIAAAIAPLASSAAVATAITTATAPLATTTALTAESAARQAGDSAAASNLSAGIAFTTANTTAAIAQEIVDRNAAVTSATADLFATSAGGNTLAAGVPGMLVSLSATGKAVSSGQFLGNVENAVQKDGGAALAGETLPYASSNGALTTAATATAIAVPAPLAMQSNALSFAQTTGACVNSNDADTAWEFGRGIIGFDGLHSDEFTLAHRSHMNGNDHALGQQADGATNVNCKAGTSVAISMNGTPMVEVDSAEATFSAPIVVSGVPTGAILSDGSSNNTYAVEVGGARVGAWVDSKNWALFGHRDVIGSTINYSFMVKNDHSRSIVNGLNSSELKVAGGGGIVCSASAFTGTHSYSVNSDRRFKTNISVPPPTKLWTDFKLIGLKQYQKVYPANVNTDELRLGVIAQELELVDNAFCKNAVRHTTIHRMSVNDPVELDVYNQGEIFTDEDGDEHSAGFKVVEYDQLYRMNIAVTQQLQARVEVMETQLAAMVAAQQ
jgi:hypothetical protein